MSRFATSNHVHMNMNQNAIARMPVRFIGLYGPRLYAHNQTFIQEMMIERRRGNISG
jgi:hypothetical protein